MSKGLREGRTIAFADGQDREVYPLTIRQLRKFLKAIDGMDLNGSEKLSDEDIDKMMNAAKIVLEKDYPDLASDPDGLEDIIDLRSFNELLATAMGTDPNG